MEGVNLHADTWVHENDRAELEQLLEDGRYEYRTRKGGALVFTVAELVSLGFWRCSRASECT